MSKFLKYAVFAVMAVLMVACGDDDDKSSGPSITGEWVSGDTRLYFGSDGSYSEDNTSSYIFQYRSGTYSYNAAQSILVLDVKASLGQNDAYTQTLIVQNLTSTSMVLLYTDGDVRGVYTRK